MAIQYKYNDSEDVLCIRLSDQPVTRDVSYGGNVSVGYSADGQPVEITLLDVIGRLEKEKAGEDEATIVLTERESRRLIELIESPPPPSERLLAAMAKHRELLRANEPSIDTDGCAWMAHQAQLLRKGALNEVQSEILAAFFEQQVTATHREVEALLRRLLIDLQKLEHFPRDRKVVDQVADFRARLRHAIEASPSLREMVASRLEHVWREARLALKHERFITEKATELPENCPYTLEQAIGEFELAIGGESAKAGLWPTDYA